MKGFADQIGEKYKAVPLVAVEDGTTLCIDVVDSISVCLIARVADYTTVTEDVASGECGLVESIVTEVVLRQKCTVGDSSSCEWLQKGSLSYYAAIGGGLIAIISIVSCCVASCCGLWAYPNSRAVMKKHLNKAFFNSADADGDDMLDKEGIAAMFKKEFGENVTIKEIDRLFEKYDTDGNGGLDFDEYKKMMKEHTVKKSTERGIQLHTSESVL